MDKDEVKLKEKGFFWIRKRKDTYTATSGITEYRGLYVDQHGLVRQK